MFLVPIGVTFLFFWLLKQSQGLIKKSVLTVLYIALAMTTLRWGEAVHTYISLYARYRSLDIIEMAHLPTTENERIHPLNSIHSLAYMAMSETEAPSLPYFVRIGNEHRWVAAIEPVYFLPRLTNGVKGLFNVSATGPYPSFSQEDRVHVHFDTGDNLLLGRNSGTATIKTFGIWRYLNYEPKDVTYLKDDSGQWVQVISLVRWKGFLFPQPESGGLQIIRQNKKSTIFTDLKRTFFGSGEWIPPNKISSHPYLVGQNILAQQVSRYIAESFRFQEGFFGPMPGFHKGDTRIPDLPHDMNNPPFTTYFIDEGVPGSLYHYFALEPFDPDKQGLSVSVLVSSDGIPNSRGKPKVYANRHHQKGESLIGASAIEAIIRDKRKEYTWGKSNTLPVEHRPWIRLINGKLRFFWLTTIVTFKGEHDQQEQKQPKRDRKDVRYIAGSVPEIVLTDGKYRTPVWVDPLTPHTWSEQLIKELGPMWKANER